MTKNICLLVIIERIPKISRHELLFEFEDGVPDSNNIICQGRYIGKTTVVESDNLNIIPNNTYSLYVGYIYTSLHSNFLIECE